MLTEISSSPETPKREESNYSKNKRKGQRYLSVERRSKGHGSLENCALLCTIFILVPHVIK